MKQTQPELIGGRYRILQEIGKGGVGSVYRARDKTEQRDVAIKEMRLRAAGLSEEARQKFMREASVLSRLSHSQIPRVFDQFTHNDSYFIVMEFIDGEDLASLVRKQRDATGGALRQAQVVEYALQVCHVLHYLHQQPDEPVLHRDIKPSNLILRRDRDEVVLVDFGLARSINPASMSTKTMAGSMGYAPEEQLQGKAEIRSDIYSLGATMYFLITGQEPPPLTVCSPRRAAQFVQSELAAVVEKATQQSPQDRYATALDMERALLGTFTAERAEGTATQAPVPPPAVAAAVPKEPKKSRWGGPIGTHGTRFHFVALSADGTVISNVILAVDKNTALDELAALNLRVLEIHRDLIFGRRWLPEKVRAESVVLMTRRLATMLSSGVRLPRALQVMAEQEDDAVLRSALLAVHQDISSGGCTLSWAMGKHPKVFDALYVSIVKIGDTTGHMASMLTHFADYLERDLRVKNQARSAMTYPAFICAVCLVVIFVIFTWILPQIMEVFSSLPNAQLPLPTRILIATCALVRQPWLQLSAVVATIYYISFLRSYFSTPQGRFNLDRIKLTAPLIGNMNKKLIVAHVCRSLGIMLRAGVPLLKALEVISETIDNEFFKRMTAKRMLEGLRQGESLGQATTAVGMFPRMVSTMLVVGESTGELPALLTRISEFYDQEIQYALEQFLTLLEPLMIGLMGVIVCFILLAVFTPLYQMIMQMT